MLRFYHVYLLIFMKFYFSHFLTDFFYQFEQTVALMSMENDVNTIDMTPANDKTKQVAHKINGKCWFCMFLR